MFVCVYYTECVCLRGVVGLGFFFVFKQKTAYEMRISDWSSDVCSSDLVLAPVLRQWCYGNATREATPSYAGNTGRAAGQSPARKNPHRYPLTSRDAVRIWRAAGTLRRGVPKHSSLLTQGTDDA